MPQSHQELFGYYMNQVLERKESDAGGDIFFTTVDESKNKENVAEVTNSPINATMSKTNNHFSKGDPLLPFPNDYSGNASGTGGGPNGEYILYRYRFFNLTLYCLSAALN
jgi:hypothetical protein